MIDLTTLLHWGFQTIVAFVSTIAFAIIFHTPKKEYLFCGITGGVGWLVYLICVGMGWGVVAGSFLATVALAWFSRIFAFRRKAPVTVGNRKDCDRYCPGNRHCSFPSLYPLYLPASPAPSLKGADPYATAQRDHFEK